MSPPSGNISFLQTMTTPSEAKIDFRPAPPKGQATAKTTTSSLGASNNKLKTDDIAMMKFPARVFYTINACHAQDPNVASWNEQGDAFIIKDKSFFEKLYLQKSFWGGKRDILFSSFQRQLNEYGFWKVNSRGGGFGESKKHGFAGDHELVYRHKNFKRGNAQLLTEIERGCSGMTEDGTAPAKVGAVGKDVGASPESRGKILNHSVPNSSDTTINVMHERMGLVEDKMDSLHRKFDEIIMLLKMSTALGDSKCGRTIYCEQTCCPDKSDGHDSLSEECRPVSGSSSDNDDDNESSTTSMFGSAMKVLTSFSAKQPNPPTVASVTASKCGGCKNVPPQVKTHKSCDKPPLMCVHHNRRPSKCVCSSVSSNSYRQSPVRSTSEGCSSTKTHDYQMNSDSSHRAPNAIEDENIKKTKKFQQQFFQELNDTGELISTTPGEDYDHIMPSLSSFHLKGIAEDHNGLDEEDLNAICHIAQSFDAETGHIPQCDTRNEDQTEIAAAGASECHIEREGSHGKYDNESLVQSVPRLSRTEGRASLLLSSNQFTSLPPLPTAFPLDDRNPYIYRAKVYGDNDSSSYGDNNEREGFLTEGGSLPKKRRRTSAVLFSALATVCMVAGGSMRAYQEYSYGVSPSSSGGAVNRSTPPSSAPSMILQLAELQEEEAAIFMIQSTGRVSTNRYPFSSNSAAGNLYN